MSAFEFLQKDIDKCKKCQTKENTKKIHLRREKESMEQRETTQMPVTLTEGLAAADKDYDRWLFARETCHWCLQLTVCKGDLSLVFDGIQNATLSGVSTTRAIQANLELTLLPNSLDSKQTQNNKMKFWTDPTVLLP